MIYSRRIPIRGLGFAFFEATLPTRPATFLDTFDEEESFESDEGVNGAGVAAVCPVAGTLTPALSTVPVCRPSFPPPASQFSLPTLLNRRVKSLTVLSGTSS